MLTWTFNTERKKKKPSDICIWKATMFRHLKIVILVIFGVSANL